MIVFSRVIIAILFDEIAILLDEIAILLGGIAILADSKDVPVGLSDGGGAGC